MPICSVFGCSEAKFGHRFPNRENSPKRFKAWSDFCKRKSFIPGKNARICRKHFLETDFDESSVLKKKMFPNSREPHLKEGVVPSVKLDELLAPKIKKARQTRNKNINKKKLINDIYEEQAETITHVNEDIYEKKSREIGVQCELGCEIIRKNENQNSNFDNNDYMNISGENLFDNLDESFENIIYNEPNNCISDRNTCFIVYWSCISKFFKNCQSCNYPVIKCKLIHKGALLSVITLCEMGHDLKWNSQPLHGKLPIGNVLMTSSLMMSGINFNSFKEFCSTLNLSMFSRTVFDKHINHYFTPVVDFIWFTKQNKMLEKIRNSSDMVWLAGDGQFDSPGFCAKFVTYSIMDLKTGGIIDFSIIQKGMVKGDLEKSACNNVLNDLITNKKIDIQLFLTDRHVGIRSMMKKQFPNILHEFDVWHLSKSLIKKFKSVDEKKYPEVIEWKKSIVNHMWYSTETCNGDSNVLIDKFTSILHHIKNEHHWKTEEGTMACDHDEIPEEVQRRKKWIHPNSESYNVLKKILTDKRFLNDLQHASNYVHTGKLESYHNMRLKYVPKRIHFPYNGMVLRSKLAIIDHNANLNKDKVGDKSQFSKATGNWVLKNKYSKTTNQWKNEIMEKVESFCTNTNTDEIYSISKVKYDIPKNIAPIPKPTVEEMRKNKFSRFSR